LAITAGSVQAQDVSAEARLKTWDLDNDGTIDMAEAKKAAAAQFASTTGGFELPQRTPNSLP
jgi:hypothetical protein